MCCFGFETPEVFGQFGQAKPKEPEPEHDPEDFKARLTKTSHIAPDLASQFESLLDQVWDSEARERMNDRIDLAVRLEQWRERMRRRGER